MSQYVITDGYCCDAGCCIRTHDSELLVPGYMVMWDEPMPEVQVSRPMFEVFRDAAGYDNCGGTEITLLEYGNEVDEFFTEEQPPGWYLTGQRWEEKKAYQKKQGLEPFD